MQPEIPEQPYSSIFQPNNCHSLILLQNCNKVISQMFSNALNTFLWVRCELEQQAGTWFVEDVGRKLGVDFRCYDCVGDLAMFLGDWKRRNNRELSYVVVCCIGCQALVEQFGREADMRPTKIVVFDPAILQQPNQIPIQQYPKSPNTSTISFPQPQQHQQQQSQCLTFTPTSPNLFLTYLQHKKIGKFEPKQLPNFVSMTNDLWASNVMIKTMYAMLNQRIQGQAKKGIVAMMRILLERISQYNQYYLTGLEQIGGFLEEIAQGELTPDKAIQWYTQQSPIHSFTNNLLRSSKNPSQTFYIQPYFHQLFNAISKMYKQFLNEYHSHPHPNNKIVCYRGGFVSAEEFGNFMSNIGGVVQNLGFLSTSEMENAALEFKINAVFQVGILGVGVGQSGFARICKNSKFPDQREILFNPLNCFTILQATQKHLPQSTEYFIKLAYGYNSPSNPNPNNPNNPYPQPPLSPLSPHNTNSNHNRSNHNSPFSQKSKKSPIKHISDKQKYIQVLQSMKSQYEVNIKCQGNVFMNGFEVMEGGGEYWEKYCEIADQTMKMEIERGMVMVMGTGREMEMRMKVREDRIQGLKKLVICRICQANFSNVQTLISQMQELIKQKYAQICQSHPFLHSAPPIDKPLQIPPTHPSPIPTLLLTKLQYSSSLSLLGHLHLHLSNPKKSLQYFSSSKQIKSSIYGDMSRQCVPDYLDIADTLMRVSQSQALQFYQVCQRILRKEKMERNLEYGMLLDRVGVLWGRGGMFGVGLEFLRKAREIKLTVSGKNSLDYIRTLRNIAQVYSKMGFHNLAQKTLTECLSTNPSLLHQNKLDLLSINLQLATTNFHSNNIQKSLQLHLHCKQQLTQIFGEKSVRVGQSLVEVGLCYENLGLYQQAERCFGDAEDVFGFRDREDREGEGVTRHFRAKLANLSQIEVMKRCFVYFQVFRIRHHVKFNGFKFLRCCHKCNQSTQRIFTSSLKELKTKLIRIQKRKRKSENYLDFKTIDF